MEAALEGTALEMGTVFQAARPASQFVAASVEGLVYHVFMNVLHPFPPVSGEFT